MRAKWECNTTRLLSPGKARIFVQEDMMCMANKTRLFCLMRQRCPFSPVHHLEHRTVWNSWKVKDLEEPLVWTRGRGPALLRSEPNTTVPVQGLSL